MAETFKAFNSILEETSDGKYITKDRVSSMVFNKEAPYEEEITFSEDMVYYLEHQNWFKIPTNGTQEEFFYSQYYTRLPNGTFRPVELRNLPQVIKDHIIRELVRQDK